MEEFDGAKVALLIGNQLITIQRDNKPGLPFAVFWDLPGGGRENNEFSLSCILREIEEELGIKLSKEHFIWQKIFPSSIILGQQFYFFVGKVNADMIDAIRFGNGLVA